MRIAAAGVCHSDLHVRQGDWVVPTPMVMGHEGLGRGHRNREPGHDSRGRRSRRPLVVPGLRGVSLLPSRPPGTMLLRRPGHPSRRRAPSTVRAACLRPGSRCITSSPSPRSPRRPWSPRPARSPSAGTCHSMSWPRRVRRGDRRRRSAQHRGRAGGSHRGRHRMRRRGAVMRDGRAQLAGAGRIVAVDVLAHKLAMATELRADEAVDA